MLNTGSFCPAFDLLRFAGFVASKFVPERGSEALVKKNLVAREGGVAGLRRAPESYSKLYYYRQIVGQWTDTKGVLHLVRYRCVPDDLGPESGLPDEEDASHIWIRERRPGDARPTDYLRRELPERIEREKKVTMRLQAQFHRPDPDDSMEWYNASVDWDEDSHPWVDLGRAALDRALDDAQTEFLLFDPNNHPTTLGIPKATGPFDYRSLGDSEIRVVRGLQRVRLWLYGAYGLPSFGQVAKR